MKIIRKLLTIAQGIIISSAVVGTWILTSSAIVISGLGFFVLPTKKLRQKWHQIIAELPKIWGLACRACIYLPQKKRWHITGNAPLHNDKWYLLIANHQSYNDIPVLSAALCQQMPLYKYFLKRQLLWSLPIGGLAMWVLDFPYVKSPTRDQIRKNPGNKEKNIQSIKKAAEKFNRNPTTVINFLEGTRFTPKNTPDKKKRLNTY